VLIVRPVAYALQQGFAQPAVTEFVRPQRGNIIARIAWAQGATQISAATAYVVGQKPELLAQRIASVTEFQTVPAMRMTAPQTHAWTTDVFTRHPLEMIVMMGIFALSRTSAQMEPVWASQRTATRAMLALITGVYLEFVYPNPGR